MPSRVGPRPDQIAQLTGTIVGDVITAGIAAPSFQTPTGGGLLTPWSVDNNGDFVPDTDNIYNIGSAGTNVLRPENIYVGTSVIIGDTITIGTDSIVGSAALSIDAAIGSDLTLSARGGSITLNDSDNTTLIPDSTFDSESLIGAINELRLAVSAGGGGGGASLAATLAVGNTTSGANLKISTSDSLSFSTAGSDIFINSSGTGILNVGASTGSFGLSVAGKLEGTSTNGQSWDIQFATIELTSITGTTAIAVGLIPAGSMVLGVTTRVTTAITGATSIDIGDDVGNIDRWGSTASISLGATTDPSNFIDNTLSWNNTFSAADVIITANGSDFTTGNIRVTVIYLAITAPTS